MGKHLKQKSAPVKTEKKSAARKQPVKPAPPRKTFLDMIAPGVMKFNPDVYIQDNLDGRSEYSERNAFQYSQLYVR